MADKASIVQVQFWRIEFIVEIENQDEENSLIFLRSVYMPNIYEVEMMKSIAIHGLDDQGKATRREQFTDLFGTWTNRIL